MHNLIFSIIFPFLTCQQIPDEAKPCPLVEQEVECISIAHWGDDIKIVFFWDLVQGEWVCLDHKWFHSGMIPTQKEDKFILSWIDDNEGCYRMISTKCWVESWEEENPLASQNQQPWFRQLLNPGLKRPN